MLIPAMNLWFRWSLEGIENIPSEGPAILAFNHISYLDPFATAYAIDKAGRRPRFLAKSELFDDRRIAWILRGTRQIEVKRGTTSAPLALDDALDALAGGEVIVIFPEGTVTKHADLRSRPPKTGAVRLALKSGAPLIPGAVWGTSNILPNDKSYRGRSRPRQDLCVRIGTPMDLRGRSDDPESWRAVGVELMTEIGVLVASLRAAVPDIRRPRNKSVA
jgi:1-acyl-sn-glycerol-3-phosphate acyltransferase